MSFVGLFVYIYRAQKKDKRKGKGKKKKKSKPKKTVAVDDDTDKLREMDENNEFGIDVQVYKDVISEELQQPSNVWQPRRDRDTPQMHNTNDRDTIIDSKEVTNDTTDIDVNLMGMYHRGIDSQLNKMHYASDTAYEQIMEDISANGIAQSDIYGKYHIDFIPDETSFKLIPPPNIYAKDAFMSQKIKHLSKSVKNKEFKNFYALTRMQQKYIKNDHSSGDESDTNTKNSDESDLENMNDMREILGSTPKDVLNVALNDGKLPQWLYESDTIMDINCGMGDNLVYLLKNFTTIKGI